MAQPLLAVLLLPEPNWPLLQRGGPIIVTIRSKCLGGAGQRLAAPHVMVHQVENINIYYKREINFNCDYLANLCALGSWPKASHPCMMVHLQTVGKY